MGYDRRGIHPAAFALVLLAGLIFQCWMLWVWVIQ